MTEPAIIAMFFFTAVVAGIMADRPQSIMWPICYASAGAGAALYFQTWFNICGETL